MNLELLTISFLGGLAVSISPCQLPIYPILLNLLSKKKVDRKVATASFSAGHAMMYSIIYLILALGFRTMDEMVIDEIYGSTIKGLYLVGALILFAFALQTLGVFNFFTKTFQTKSRDSDGIFGAFLSGAFFATIVSPCNLPYLIAVYLPLLANSNTILDGLIGILVFTLTLSTPLLLMGLVSTHALEKILKKHMKKVEIFSAGLLILMSLYFVQQALF